MSTRSVSWLVCNSRKRIPRGISYNGLYGDATFFRLELYERVKDFPR